MMKKKIKAEVSDKAKWKLYCATQKLDFLCGDIATLLREDFGGDKADFLKAAQTVCPEAGLTRIMQAMVKQN